MLERAQRRPALITVFKLADALGVRPWELVAAFEDRVRVEDVSRAPGR